MTFKKPHVTCEWLSTQVWQRELAIWFFWSFAILGSMLAISVGIWPLAIHLTLMACLITCVFRLVVHHKHAKKDFKVDTETFQ